MAGGFIATGSPGKNYPGKLTGRVFWTCFVAAFGGLIFGYDLGISGTFNLYQSNYPLILIVLFITHIKICRWCDFHGSFLEEVLPRSV